MICYTECVEGFQIATPSYLPMKNRFDLIWWSNHNNEYTNPYYTVIARLVWQRDAGFEIRSVGTRLLEYRLSDNVVNMVKEFVKKQEEILSKEQLI